MGYVKGEERKKKSLLGYFENGKLSYKGVDCTFGARPI